MTTCMEMAVHLAVTVDVFDGVLFCPFSHEMSWMRFGIEFSQFLRISIPNLAGPLVLSYDVSTVNSK